MLTKPYVQQLGEEDGGNFSGGIETQSFKRLSLAEKFPSFSVAEVGAATNIHPREAVFVLALRSPRRLCSFLTRKALLPGVHGHASHCFSIALPNFWQKAIDLLLENCIREW